MNDKNLNFEEEIEDEHTHSVVFRDVILLTLIGLVTILLLIIAFINPPKKKEEGEVKLPGELVIEMIWDEKRNIDMDLWVKAPDEPPVGFSNRKSLTVNLLRDDLGHYRDISNLNYEHVYVRKTKKGHYVINAHSYRWDEKEGVPMEVQFIITYRPLDGVYANAKKVYTRKLEWDKGGIEKTVMTFDIDENGNIVPESIKFDYEPLLTLMGN